MLDLIESVPLEDRVMRLNEITEIFTKHLKSRGLEYIDANRQRLTTYGIFTLVCLVLDLLLFIWTVWAMFRAEIVLSPTTA